MQFKIRYLIKLVSISICAGCFFEGFLHAKPLSCFVSAESAILMNADTGKILFQKNAFEPRYPASITKIAIGLYTLKSFQHLMDKRISCSREALKCITEAEKSKENYSKYPSYVLETDMSHMGLKIGEEMSFRDLLLGAMIVSADDASNVIAEIAGDGSIEDFMQAVNNYLVSLGLKNTKLCNPHGLHHPEHVSTAYDIALLNREAIKDPQYVEIMKMSRYERPKTNKQEAVPLKQTNKLMVKTSPHYYPYATSGKTGYHRRARHNLASTAEKDGRRLIAVVLSCEKRPSIFEDTKKLFEAAFDEKKVQRTVFNQGIQKFQREIQGGKSIVSTYTQEPLSLSFYPAEEPEIRCQLIWDNVEAPLKKGDHVGEIQLLADNILVKKVALFSANDVDVFFSYFLKQKIRLIVKNPILLVVLSGSLLFVFYFLILRRRNRFY